jgi:hypothetical protein
MLMMRATISRRPLVICFAVTVCYTALRMRKVLSSCFWVRCFVGDSQADDSGRTRG